MTRSLQHSLIHSLRRLWTLDAFSYSLRMLIALGGVMAVGFWLDEMALVRNSRLSVQPVKDSEWEIVCALGKVTA